MMPYRKQSVFVAPSGLSSIVSTHQHVNTTTNHQYQHQHHQHQLHQHQHQHQHHQHHQVANERLNNSQTIESLNNLKFDSKSKSILPKPNAQILEQHISKIISENAAIVETLDPLWSKRFMSRHSTCVPPNHVDIFAINELNDSTTTNNNTKNTLNYFSPSMPRRYSESSTSSMANNSSQLNRLSKLQSALLGKSNNDLVDLGSIQPTNTISNKSVLNSEINEKSNQNFHKSSVIINAKDCNLGQQSNLNSNSNTTSSQNAQNMFTDSIVRNLLTAKAPVIQVAPIKEKPKTPPPPGQHPQNPEGSIIKDLLLKSREDSMSRKLSRNELGSSSSSATQNIIGNKSIGNNISPEQESSMLVYVCTVCKIAFRNKENLEVHQVHYCKGICDDILPEKQSKIDDLVQRKVSVMARPNILQRHLQRINQNSNSTNQFCNNQVPADNRPAPVGNILKQQLLAPSQGPPLKKRKISEPVFRSNNYDVEIIDERPFERSISRKISVVQQTTKSTTLQSATKVPVNFSSSEFTNRLYPSVIHPVKHNTVHGTMPIAFGNCASIPIISAYSDTNNNLHGHYMKPVKRKSDDHKIKSKIEILPEYLPHLSKPSTKITIKGPILFPVLQNLIDSKNNLEFIVDNHAERRTSTPFIQVPSIPTVDVIDDDDLNNQDNKMVEDQENKIIEDQENKMIEDQENNMAEGQVNKMIENRVNKMIEDQVNNMENSNDNQTEMNENSIEMKDNDNLKQFIPKTSSAIRPTSLSLKVSSGSLISSTLISPDTPRSKKNCVQLYINGHAYTNIGLKVTTRPTFCCIYRAQPMFVFQETSPGLSMYCNWKAAPLPQDDILNLIPPQVIISKYHHDLKKRTPLYFTTNAWKCELNSTHSSYWTFRSNDDDKEKLKESIEMLRDELGCSEDDEMRRKTSGETVYSSDDFDEREGENGIPKTVRVFEGGFKSNEDYTYVRGRGRGKYVCEECGIRCKKPSMLKKHIRTHTDLRPYSCRHCAFAFKTKGNLTKHMKSKAHHKKCVELGIIPVPVTIDDSQIDTEALAKQEILEISCGGNLPEDEDDEEEEGDEGDDDEEEDDEDDEGVPISLLELERFGPKPPLPVPGQFDDVPEDLSTKHRDSFDRDNNRVPETFPVPFEVEKHEAAKSLLILSGSESELTGIFANVRDGDGKCICSICNKVFSRSSQLRLHINIHYFERPFRCESCAVSFRTKGHLQKHKRSVSHFNKVNMNLTFGTPTTDNPRPFKCADCKIAFRIHGHLAKHLRSKMHIMKLECLGKLPFGMYAEMERSGINLNEIDTTDCENSLQSLQCMAQRLYDPRQMRWEPVHDEENEEKTLSTSSNESSHFPSHHDGIKMEIVNENDNENENENDNENEHEHEHEHEHDNDNDNNDSSSSSLPVVSSPNYRHKKYRHNAVSSNE